MSSPHERLHSAKLGLLPPTYIPWPVLVIYGCFSLGDILCA